MRTLFAVLLGTLTGCAHRSVSWVETNQSVLAPEVAQVTVRSDDPACAGIERGLRNELLRRGLSVTEAAPVHLSLSACEREVRSELGLRTENTLFNESQGADGLRQVQVWGSGRAELRVAEAGSEGLVLVSRASAEDAVGWRQKPDDAVARQVGLERELDTLLAEDLAQQVRPQAVERRRRAFRRAEPGSPEAALNAAVAAEQAGDVERALDLAREAYVRKPTWWALDYVDELEARAGRHTEVVELLGTH